MKKILSLLLAVTLLLGVAVPGTLAIRAQADDGETTDPSKGMVINKTATAVDGGFEITLEAYATGTKVITEVSREVPTDIILVLDQSGSMDDSFTTSTEASWTERKATNQSNFFQANFNDNLWYKVGDSYVKVTVTRTAKDPYTEATLTINTMVYTAYTAGVTYYAEENGNYYPVTIEKSNDRSPNYTYIYSNGSTTVTKTSTGDYSKSPLTLHRWNITTEYDYEYSYTDATTGESVVIEKSTGNNTTSSGPYYERRSSGTTTDSKLNALKTAVENFVKAVNSKAKGPDGQYGTNDDINHRIAVVGFASNDEDYNYSQYENTEVFVGGTGYIYPDKAKGQYSKAFQNMNTQAGYDNVIASKNALDAEGGTFTNLGMEMANGIFAANPIDTNEQRNRVIIVFTDGYPGTGGSVSSTVANSAVSKAYTSKNTYNATVYTVGIFNGANGSPVSDFNGVSNPNKFMHLLSSNYKNAQSYSNSSKYGAATYPAGGSSYYLSAGDSGSLNEIFQQIASQIQTGGSSTTLGAETVIKDIIAPQFQLPANATAANITLETYACTGKDTSGEYTWSKNSDAKGAKATVSGDTVSVTGFDFAKNWVGQENNAYRGNKLVIKFKVETKPGFLGGNDVFTNTSAGVYENATATDPVMEFPKPKVNVPIADVTVTAPDKNIYLLGSLTAEQIKSGATAKCGDVTLTLGADNYGLQTWQTDYVNITVTYKDADGNDVTNLSDLKADTTYTVSVTVSPKIAEPTSTQGTKAQTKSNTATGKINVFKPQLTFKDSDVYYGDTAPTGYSGNKTGEVWKHGETTSTDPGITMTGTAPTLALTYTPEDDAIDTSNKIATKEDIPVKVTVKIGQTDVTDKTTFVHTKCSGETTDPTDGQFWLHVKTCSLTIKKQAATGTTIGNDEYFVFKVKKDGVDYTEVTIKGTGSVTITGLPVGTYTVTEDSGIAWRYTSTSNNGSVELSKDNSSATVTCTNTLKNGKWLNDFQQVVNTYNPQASTD